MEKLLVFLIILFGICVASAQNDTLSNDDEKMLKIRRSYDEVIRSIDNMMLLTALRRVGTERLVMEKNMLGKEKKPHYVVMGLEESVAYLLGNIKVRKIGGKSERKFGVMYDKYIGKPCESLIEKYQQIKNLAYELEALDPYEVISKYGRYYDNCKYLMKQEIRSNVQKQFKKELRLQAE